MKHLNIEVIGVVQGVSFRYYTKEEAHNHGINGYVMNRGDGSVFIEAEGADAMLTLFLQWCHKGPPYASVNQVKIKEGELQSYHSFEIRY